MANMFESFKKELSSITPIVVAVAAIIGATITFESRYASAKEVEQMKKENVIMLQQLKQDNRVAVDSLRKQQLEDKIFELNIRTVKTPVEHALIERYNQQLKEVTQRINQAPAK